MTTNDGIPSRETSSPMQSPMNVPVRMQAAIARGHGQPWFVATMPRTAAAVPAVKPADRSISPSSSTKTRPMAMTMTPADWLKRLAKLNWLVNVRRAAR